MYYFITYSFYYWAKIWGNDLKQQPCACCLNFNAVSEVAKVIDDTKRQLGEEKEQLQNDNNQLRQDKEELRVQKGYLEGQLEVTKRQVEVQEGKLREEIQDKEVLKNEINNLKSGNNKNAGAAQVAENVNKNLSNYINELNNFHDLNKQLENEKLKIFEEKTNLIENLNKNNEELQKKENELENTKKKIEELKNTKKGIEDELKIKDENIKKCATETNRLIEEKAKLAKELEELKDEKKKNEEKYNTIISNYEKTVGENAQQLKGLKDLLETWNKNNKDLNVDINNKKEKINELNKKIEENNLNIDKLNKEKEKLDTKYNDLNIAHEKLKQKYEEIEQGKKELEDSFKVCKGQMEYLTTQTNTLNDILKNIKTNVNMEEYANLYNSINAQKRTNISILLNKDVKTFPQKQYTFYIPFKFKDYGQCAIKKTISDVFTKNPGIYTTNLSLYDILRSFFEIKAFEKFKELKIIKVTNLKEIYFDVSFNYDGDKIKIEGKGDKVEDNRTKAIELPKIVTSPKTQGNAKYIKRNEKNEVTNYDDIAKGEAYKTYMNKFFLDYSQLIELVGIDEYLNKKGDGKIEDEKDKIKDKIEDEKDKKKDKIEDEKDKKKDKIKGKKDKIKNKIEDKKDKVEEKEDLFLLELDFKDPECIALLESVGKGNYGVVKKGLTKL